MSLLSSPSRAAMLMRLAALCLLAVAATPAAYSATLYVATWGSDGSTNPYNVNTPFYSVNKAASWANPGDTIKLRGGTYQYTDEQWVGKSGNASNRLYVQSYDNEWAVLDGSSRNSGNTVLSIGGSFVTLRWLEVKNSKGIGVSIWGGGNDVIYGCNVSNSYGTGISIDFNNNNLSNTPLYNNRVEACSLWNNVRMNQPRTLNGGWGMAITAHKARNTTVVNCDVSANWGEGIGFYLCNGGYVGQNRVHDNYSTNLYLDNATYVTLDGNTVDTQYWGDYYRYNAPASGIQMANESYDISNPLRGNVLKNNTIKKCSRGLYYGNYQNGGGFKDTDIYGNRIESSWWYAAQTDAADHSGSKVHDNTFVKGTGTNATDFKGTGLSVYSNTYQ